MTEASTPVPFQRSVEELAAQKKRNIWLAFALVAFVVLVGVSSAIRVQSVDFSKSDGFYLDGKAQTRKAPPPVLDAPVGQPE